MDERAFNELRSIRAGHGGLTLAEFKQILREQFFSLLLDRDGALAAIPKMLPADPAVRTEVLDAIRRTAESVGTASGDRAERLAQIEKLFADAKPVEQEAKGSGKAG